MTSRVRKTKITIKRHEITIIRSSAQRIIFFCHRCQSNVAAYTPRETARRFHISIGEINSLAKTGEIHFIETTESSLPLVCGGQPGKEKLF